jgi:HprK-related kinase A
LLGEAGWRFMGDEFALIDPETGLLHPFPRAISLKNQSLALFEAANPERLGPVLKGTPKGMIRHLRPPVDAIARMDEPARPALILFPRFGRDFEPESRPVGAAETFVRLTQASTNYVALGERGFTSLSGLVSATPAFAIDYRSGEEAAALIDGRWNAAS